MQFQNSNLEWKVLDWVVVGVMKPLAIKAQAIYTHVQK